MNPTRHPDRPLWAENVDYPAVVAGALRVHAFAASGRLAMHHRRSAVRRPREGSAEAGGASAPPREAAEVTVGLSPRVNLNQHLNLVAVDFIGGDGAEGSIPCLEDDDRDHERGGE